MGTEIRKHDCYKLVTLKAASLNNIIKCKRVANFLKGEKACIICLQETHLKEEEQKLLTQVFRGEIYCVPTISRACGVMIRIVPGFP